MRKRLVIAGLLMGACAVMTTAREANAQAMAPINRISASPQGAIGGGLLGMELVMLIEGAAGVRNGWIMLGTGLAGAAGGVVGGYFLDRALDDTSSGTAPDQGLTFISTGLLVVGLGLIIPTAIVFTGATMYRPPEVNEQGADDATTTSGALDESTGSTPATGSTTTDGAGAGGTGSGSTPTPTSNSPSTGNTSMRRHRARPAQLARRMPTGSLLSVGPQGASVGMPALGIVRSISIEEQRQYNLAPQSEWRLPVLDVAF